MNSRIFSGFAGGRKAGWSHRWNSAACSHLLGNGWCSPDAKFDSGGFSWSSATLLFGVERLLTSCGATAAPLDRQRVGRCECYPPKLSLPSSTRSWALRNRPQWLCTSVRSASNCLLTGLTSVWIRHFPSPVYPFKRWALWFDWRSPEVSARR